MGLTATCGGGQLKNLDYHAEEAALDAVRSSPWFPHGPLWLQQGRENCPWGYQVQSCFGQINNCSEHLKPLHLESDLLCSQLCKPRARSSACQTPAQISAWVITADPKHCMWLKWHFLPCLSFPHLTQNNNDTTIFTCPPEEISKSTFLSTYHLSFLLRLSLCTKGEMLFFWTFRKICRHFCQVAYKKLFSRGCWVLPGNALSH